MFVDDFGVLFSTPWANRKGCLALSLGAAFNGVVFEGGVDGKSFVSFASYPAVVKFEAERAAIERS